MALGVVVARGSAGLGVGRSLGRLPECLGATCWACGGRVHHVHARTLSSRRAAACVRLPGVLRVFLTCSLTSRGAVVQAQTGLRGSQGGTYRRLVPGVMCPKVQG